MTMYEPPMPSKFGAGAFITVDDHHDANLAEGGIAIQSSKGDASSAADSVAKVPSGSPLYNQRKLNELLLTSQNLSTMKAQHANRSTIFTFIQTKLLNGFSRGSPPWITSNTCVRLTLRSRSYGQNRAYNLPS